MADINEARTPSVTQILKAGRKPREVFEAGSLGVETPVSIIETISNLAPEMQRKQIAARTVAELVKALESEGFGGIE
jgi:electron transfer flavoprotein beta subunit